MNGFIRPEVVYEVPTKAGELHISPEHDILHRWSKVGAHILKYIHNGEEGISLKNIVLSQEGAQFLIDNCDIVICERDWMSTQEHEHWLEFQMMTQMTDFEAEFTGDGYDDIIEP